MNLFDKLIASIQGFFSQFFANQHQPNLAYAIIEKQKRSQKRLKESMTELIFQRKKFEAQLIQLQNNKIQLKEDLQIAALEDRDELALRLMEEMDILVKEVEECQKNCELVKKEIQTAKQVEVELASQITRSESQLTILASRSQSVKMREDLKSQFSKLHKEISSINPSFTKIEESIMHLEARMENIDDPKDHWKSEVAKMRKKRTDHFRKSRLEQLKAQLKAKSLPGRAVVPEIIPVTH